MMDNSVHKTDLVRGNNDDPHVKQLGSGYSFKVEPTGFASGVTGTPGLRAKTAHCLYLTGVTDVVDVQRLSEMSVNVRRYQ